MKDRLDELLYLAASMTAAPPRKMAPPHFYHHKAKNRYLKTDDIAAPSAARNALTVPKNAYISSDVTQRATRNTITMSNFTA
jgi:hypothetical protein